MSHRQTFSQTGRFLSAFLLLALQALPPVAFGAEATPPAAAKENLAEMYRRA